MADETVNLTHEYLRRMDAKLDRLIDDMQDVKVRLASLEENVSGKENTVIETRQGEYLVGEKSEPASVPNVPFGQGPMPKEEAENLADKLGRGRPSDSERQQI